ncbi:GspH/FimT family pseudopilin [Pseudoalteromonas sp. G4]|uniref:GspH/FimT family pseudopilin n=1 Tax=Pseudoalteromonas sp. G4 TaxID=2992761 RepID=UPI00237DD2F1|nr:GspH/FimT family pseudopilin [Pseudoalteromonas sp. G4]MDE3272807.1 GspH/FimT family pseudopilin [Pseudoalteromonas sp. G4]
MKNGYTLIELVVVSSIVGVLSTVAIPSMITTIKSDRLVTTANQLTSTFKFARSEAVKRETDVQLVVSGEDWLVQLDGETIMTFSSIYSSVSVNGLANMTVRASGETTSINLTIEDGDADTVDRCFSVLVSGQSQLTKGGCVNESTQ